MSKRPAWWGVVCLFAAVAWGQEIRSAGELFVYLDATNVTGLSDGAYVASWTNRGSLAEFVPAFPGKGATYAAGVGGAAALRFDGTKNSAMALAGHTNNATKGGVPLSILGSNVWSAEVWVCNPAASNIETLLAWTSRRDGSGRNLMEMRYGSDVNNAVEHYARNIGWTVGLPAFGQWHHVACTRDAACTNRLYLDGRLLTALDMGGANMLNLTTNNALFGVGAVDTGSGWDYPLSGAIAVVRVHGGTLSAADVLNNFTVERSRFGGGWLNAGAGAWNDPANWENGAVPSATSPVYIGNGGTAGYDGAPYAGGAATGMWHAVHGGMTLTGGSYVPLPTFSDTLIRLGVGAGSAFTLGLAGGTFDTRSDTLRPGDTAAATGTVNVNAGGRLITARLQKGNGTAYLNADGGVIEAVSTATDFLQGLDSAKVKAGGLTFDVPTNVTVTVAQALQEDAASRGGGLSKAGSGMLNLTGANTVTGALAVSGGSLFIQSNALSSAFAAPVTLSNGGNIGWNQTGGAAILASHLTAGSWGSLTLYAPNTNDSINLSAVSNVTLRTDGTLTYTGTLTPYTNLFLFAPNNGTLTFSQAIADQPGVVGRLESRGNATGFLRLTGDSSYTGGTLLESGGIIMTHANALGAGTESVKDIVCRTGTVLRVQVPLASATFFGRVAADPYMSLQLSGGGLTNTLDFSSSPNIFTGTENTSVKSYYVGTLTPYGDTYLLGNSGVDPNDGSFGFVVTNLTDGAGATPRRVLIKGVGAVDTRNNASHSGGTRVEDGGKIIVTGDRGFGAVPGVFDPSNIVFNNGGVFRTESRFVSLAKTRGIVFGPGTTRIHASGGLPAQLTIPGDVSGAGTLRMTDWGWVAFAGTNNTYSGRIQLEGSIGAAMIGDGTNFSWSSTGGIVGTGSKGWLYLNNGGDDTFADVFSGNGLLTKKGVGTVTLAAAQTNKQLPTNTVIEAGALRYGVSGALASGAGAGVVDIARGAALDVNGFVATVNGLTGGGCVSNSADTAVEVRVGSDTLGSSFSGSFASPLTLTKIGTNSLVLTHPNPTREAVTVSAGTLALNVGTALTNGVEIADGATVQALGCQNLRGEYFDNAFTGTSGGTWPALGTTPEAVDAVLAGLTPTLIAGSGCFGDTFDSGTTGARFPGKYSGSAERFAVRWTGQFLAEQAGSHTFRVFADDGCLVFLDGQIVVNNRTGGAWTTSSATLTQGWHDIIVFFYENSGLQVVRVFMTPPGGTDAALPQRLLRALPTTVAGLVGAAGSRVGADAFALLIVDQGDDTLAGGFSGSAATNAVIEKQGAGVITLQQTGSFSGITRIEQGGITLAAGVSHTGAFDVVAGALTVSGGTNVDTAPVLIGSLSGTAAGALNLAAKTFLRINQTTNGVFGGTVTGGTADSVIAKAGAAELVLTNDVSAYPGSWDVVAGSLVIGDGGLLSSSAAVAVRAGAALVFRSSTNLVFAGTISGVGAVRNEGPGTLTLTGAVSSGIQVAAGQTVILDRAAVSGIQTLSGAYVNEGTLIINTPGTNYLASAITGDGEVRVGANTRLMMGRGGVTDSQSVTLSGGTLALNNGGTLGFDDNLWVTNGVSRFRTNELGDVILEGNPNLANTVGSVFYKYRVAATNAWRMSTVFRRGTPGGCAGGDGFAVLFQNDARGVNALGTAGSVAIATITPSFGYRFYLMSGSSKLGWVVNGSMQSGEITTNLFSQGGGVFTADLVYDGSQLVVTMQQGVKTLTVTNTGARAQLEAIGGVAYVGVGSATGGCYGQQFIDACSFINTEEGLRSFTNAFVLAAETASTVEAAQSVEEGLPLVAGDLVFNAGSSLDAVPAPGTDPNLPFVRFGNLSVLGSAALTVAPEGKAALAGGTWTFTAGALLTLTGALTLPETVHVAINGTIPRGRMYLADFRAADIENLENVTFVLDGDDGKTQLICRDGWLYTSRTLGTLMLLQ